MLTLPVPIITVAAPAGRSWRRALRHPLWAAYKTWRAWLRQPPATGREATGYVVLAAVAGWAALGGIAWATWRLAR